ncbi:organic cation transporter protein-like isoform X1 [Periplaneta americana]|uniref:organic cation transporter protein-like isoform X1 n=1 Tax=Periplaneta americana TaxID=6978 RepID=UPI0037E9AF31
MISDGNDDDDTVTSGKLLPRQDESDNAAVLMDDLIRHVDNEGAFQNAFNNLFNFFAVIVGVMSVYSLVLAMKVPNHWCHVPGRDNTNLTLTEWKNYTLPRDKDNREMFAYSKCLMYNVTIPLVVPYNKRDLGVVNCQYGWEYDRRWFHKTVPSQENWVCDKSLYVTNTFVVTQIGEAVGTIFFGHMSDTVGRRPVFLITLALLIVGRGLSVLTPSYYWLYLVTVFLGHSALSSLCFAATTIGIELSQSEHRAYIVMLQSLGWTSGMCLIPLLAWLTADWTEFVLLPLLPASCIFICSCSLFIESPRWLASRGKISRCLATLRHIADNNKLELPDSAENTLRRVAEQSRGKVLGPSSFLSSTRLATNTALLVTCWMLNCVSYVILLLNVNNMSGNPFLNFFWQSAVELPAGFVAKWLSDRVGRRSTQTFTFLVIAASSFCVSRIVNNPNLHEVTTTTIIFVKFCVTITNFVCYLQAMEIFPTCLRQTGMSVANVAGNAGGVLAPYVVYLGSHINQKYPYIVLCAMALLGTAVSSFLPETLNKKLPDNIKDAKYFGRNEKYWSFCKKSSEGESYTNFR